MDLDLHITTDPNALTAELDLRDAHGRQLAYHLADFAALPLSQHQALFGLREWLERFVPADREEEAVAQIGVHIAEQVLGEALFLALWRPTTHRALRLHLPASPDALAALLARVPWEIARPAANTPTLAERHLHVRLVPAGAAAADLPLALGAGEPLRVLFVFAEAPGTRPLAMRRERRELEQMFAREVYPRRRVVAHFLSHGVTRERLQSQFAEQGGYHVLHWSGHGHLDRLELARAGGRADHLSGAELLALCDGYLPRLYVLSACHSGDVQVRDWQEFRAVAAGGGRPAASRDIPIEEQAGATGSAHALLRGGVPAVVAMRFAVGDDYARELAVEFYRALFAHPQPKEAAAAGQGLTRVLGSLDPGEAALYLGQHPALGRMLFGDDPAERALAERLLTASRFHPLLLDRLARLADAAALRPQLLETNRRAGAGPRLRPPVGPVCRPRGRRAGAGLPERRPGRVAGPAAANGGGGGAAAAVGGGGDQRAGGGGFAAGGVGDGGAPRPGTAAAPVAGGGAGHGAGRRRGGRPLRLP